MAIEKGKAYFKWCDEHPDKLEKRCLEHYPKLEIGGTKATMDISDELWDAYEREVEAEWLEADTGSDWRERKFARLNVNTLAIDAGIKALFPFPSASSMCQSPLILCVTAKHQLVQTPCLSFQSSRSSSYVALPTSAMSSSFCFLVNPLCSIMDFQETPARLNAQSAMDIGENKNFGHSSLTMLCATSRGSFVVVVLGSVPVVAPLPFMVSPALCSSLLTSITAPLFSFKALGSEVLLGMVSLPSTLLSTLLSIVSIRLVSFPSLPLSTLPIL